MARRFRQIDVFGSAPCTGNPVAVVLDADGLSDADMARISTWTNLSECTFVLPPLAPGADYRVRIFNLSTELPFAGHPTLGTARAWLDAGGIPATPGTVVQECGIGEVPVRVDGEVMAFAAPPLIRSGPVDPDDLVRVLDVLGVEPGAVLAAEWVDNGLGWVAVLLASTQEVLAVRPDASRHPQRWDIGVVAIAGEAEASGDGQLEVRAFFTDGTDPIREDPVTGSLNASLAQWLLRSGRLTAPYVARQGTAIGRSGRVHVDVDGDGTWIGGRTDVVVSGTLDDS